jgi:hypothetical protein
LWIKKCALSNVFIYTYTHINTYTHTYIYIIYTYIYKCIYIFEKIYMDIHIYIHINIFILCIFIYTYTHTHINTYKSTLSSRSFCNFSFSFIVAASTTFFCFLLNLAEILLRPRFLFFSCSNSVKKHEATDSLKFWKTQKIWITKKGSFHKVVQERIIYVYIYIYVYISYMCTTITM